MEIELDKKNCRDSDNNKDNKNFEEYQYTNLIKQILKFGAEKQDRTNIGTIGIFGHSMRFNLANSFPLLTTKKVFWKGVVEELLWFIGGCTDSKLLSSKGIKIWDDNGTREFLDSRGLVNREVGDLGPVYGFQWRHWGAQYNSCNDNYSGSGIDQLKLCIDLLKKDPNSRRICLSAWNPSDLEQMALPPCHMFCQFYVAGGKLSCSMYQRSCDVGLGVPFNIASYALLTCIMAKICGLKRGEFVYFMGDTHIYKTHIEVLIEQSGRIPYDPPQLIIGDIDDIDKVTANDIKLINYKYHENIKMKMAI